jgi:hypothetical protein
VFYLFGSKKEEREFLVGSLAVVLFWFLLFPTLLDVLEMLG